MSLLPSATWPPLAPPGDDRYGRATITPAEPVVAGAFGTWTIEYVAGLYGIDDGGALRIAFHTISDWGAPQFSDPAAPDYCTIAWTIPPPCRIEARYDSELGVRPWKRVIQFRVRDAAVRPGDRLLVTIGDRSGGSPGARAQTFAGRMRFKVLLDAFGTGVYVPTGEPVTLPVVAGPPDHLRVHAPTDVRAGERFALTVVARDRWGNVVWRRRQPARLDQPGVYRLPFTDEATGLQGTSNPVRCSPAALHSSTHSSTGAHAAAEGAPSAPPYRVFWGDLHAQTEETIGSGTLDEYFTFARECAAIDFVGHQGNDFQITRAVWEQIMRKTQEYDEAHRFITFAGYEWSGNTPGGGDHNVHFRGGAGQRYDLHRSSHWQVYDRSDEATDRYPVSALYETFRGRDDVLLIPHVGGRYANLANYFDQALMPLVEICSCWGVFEWFAGEAFRRRAVFGFSAGSDDHTARPGMSATPRGHFATGGGLTAVLAAERSRDAIWEALQAHRTYATTGARILLDVVARAGGRSAPVGSILECSQGETVELAVQVCGTAPLWRVEVLRWLDRPEVVYAYPFAPPALPRGRHHLRIGWTGARIRARHRLTCWDGTLSLDRGRIVAAAGWGFDQPEQGVIEAGEQVVRWRSETAGDWDGVVVECEAPDDAVLRFASGPATFSFSPRDLGARPMVVDAGGESQRVEVERDPGPAQPLDVAFVYRAAAPARGRDPYIVRVTQQDGHVAWSSPIFLAVSEATG